jgi:hypothetical protein
MAFRLDGRPYIIRTIYQRTISDKNTKCKMIVQKDEVDIEKCEFL